MKNFKKFFAVLVVVTLMVSSIIIPANAAEGTTTTTFSYEKQAKDLYDLKLFAGRSTEAYVPDLGSALTRQDGIILLLRLLGKEAAALALTDSEATDAIKDYTDKADVASYAKKYIAYSVKNDIVKGTTDTLLSPKANLDGKTYATMILRAIGYTVNAGDEFNKACTTLVEKGGLTAEEAAKFNDKALIRDDVVGISYGALKAKYPDGKTIIEKLVADGVVDQKTAEGLGLVGPAVTAAVYSAAAENGKLTVVMSADIETPKAEDFAITQAINGAAATSVTGTVYGYTYETKTAVINVPAIASTDADQSVVYSISYKGTTAVSAPALIVPGNLKVDSVTSLNAGQVAVKFNTAVDSGTATTAGNYSIDNGITIAAASLSTDKKTVTLTTASGSPFAVGTTYNVTVSTAVKDANGKALSQAATLPFTASDSAIPAVASVEAKGNSAVKVTFSEPIKNEFLIDKANYQINDVAPLANGTASADNTSVEFDVPLSIGENSFKIVTGNTITDYAGYKIIAGTTKFNVVGTTTATQAISATLVNQNTVTVKFDNLVRLTDGGAYSGNFYWNQNGTSGYKQYIADAASTVSKVDDKTFSVKFTSTSNYIKTGTAYFFVEGLTDYYGNTVPAAKFTLSVNADAVATLTKSEAVSEGEIQLTFDKDLDSSTISTSTVTVKNPSGAAVTLNSVTYDPANKIIDITFDKQAGGNYAVTFSGVKTTTGNAIPAQTVTVAITDKTPISTISVNAVNGDAAKDYAIVKFPESMATTGDFSIGTKGKYTYSVGVGNTNYSSLGTSDTLTVVDDKTVKIVFNNETVGTGNTLNISVSLVADKAGIINSAPVTGSAVALATADKLNINTATVKMTDLRTIQVVVNRLMNAVSLSDFIIYDDTDKDGDLVNDSADATIFPAQATYENATDGSNTATITLTVSSDLDTSKDYYVRTTTVGGTKDANDLQFASDATSVKVTNYLAPKITSVSVQASNKLVVAFDKDVDMVVASDFIAKVGDDSYTPDTVGITTANTAPSAIKLANGADDKVFVLTYTLPAGTSFSSATTLRTTDPTGTTDEQGNNLTVVAPASSLAVSDFRINSVQLQNNGAAGTIAVGDAIVIKFSQKVNPASIIASWNGSETTLSSGDFVQFVNGTNDTLTFAPAIGTIDLGATDVVSANVNISKVKVSLSSDGLTLTIKFNDADELTDAATDADLDASKIVPPVTITPDKDLKADSGAYVNSGYSAVSNTKF